MAVFLIGVSVLLVSLFLLVWIFLEEEDDDDQRKSEDNSNDQNKLESRSMAIASGLSELIANASDQTKKKFLNINSNFNFKLTIDLELLVFYYFICIEMVNFYIKPKHIVKPVLDNLENMIEEIEEKYVDELKRYATNYGLENEVNKTLEEYKDLQELHHTRYKQYQNPFREAIKHRGENKFLLLSKEFSKNVGESKSPIFHTMMSVVSIEYINSFKKYLKHINKRNPKK
jgi:hypothetical protein